MQVTPALIGLVLLYVVMGQFNAPDLDTDKGMLKLLAFLLLATAALLYGFAMHLYALGYPESPFNRHCSSLLMTLLCAGPLAYVAYRFHALQMQTGFIAYGVLCLLVVGLSAGFAFYRNGPD